MFFIASVSATEIGMGKHEPSESDVCKFVIKWLIGCSVQKMMHKQNLKVSDFRCAIGVGHVAPKIEKLGVLTLIEVVKIK